MLTHLGIIADGNRRWAKEHGLTKLEGHRQGFSAIETLVEGAIEKKIPFITFYVFSTENWGRAQDEVDHLMMLAEKRIIRIAERMAKNNAKLLILGTRERVSPRLSSLLDESERMTADCTGTTVCLCFNYGGEKEIADAATRAAAEGEITPETIRSHLYHPEVPDVDMVVRTSGEERISGFMLWRVAYAEFMFMKKFFPDMSKDDLQTILEEYDRRNRRFGK